MLYIQSCVKCAFLMKDSFETVMSEWISFPYISKVGVLTLKTMHSTVGI